MVANRMEPPKPGGESPKGNPASTPSAKETASAPASAAGGGLKSWLPLILAVVLMPILAYATTNFVLLPKMQKSLGMADAEPANPIVASEKSVEHGKPAAEKGKPAAKPAKKGGGEGAGEKKVSLPLKKVLVNVANTQASRFLLANITVVGLGEEFKKTITENMDQLADLTSSALATKTIGDLEKPGARNLIRAELIAVFNNALGADVVQEVYLTDLAIQ